MKKHHQKGFSFSSLSKLAITLTMLFSGIGPAIGFAADAPDWAQAFPFRIQPGSTLSQSLLKVGISHWDIHALTQAARPLKNLNSIRAGTRFRVVKTDGRGGLMVQFRLSQAQELHLEKLAPKKTNLQSDASSSSGPQDPVWIAREVIHPIKTEVISFKGQVRTTLWESAQDADMDPYLISELAEIFAWQVDFSREVRKNDLWRLIVERKTINGAWAGWGKILAAEYHGEEESYQAVLHREEIGEESIDKGYFMSDGASLRRMFLKSPIRFGRISSRFQRRRFHPILKRHRPHLGVDYAAPRGTPIRAAGDGRISYQGYRGGGGKTLIISHNSTYKTAYKHLSRYAKGLRRGSRIQQGQIIGYVGSTGLATGPHLHFEFYQNGRFVDPLGQKFPSANPVPKKSLAEFQSQARFHLARLPHWYDPSTAWMGEIAFFWDGNALKFYD